MCCLILFICKLPYKLKTDNATQIVNIIVLLSFLGFAIVRDWMFETIKKEANEFFLLMIFHLIVIGNILMNIVRMVKMVMQIWKKKKNKQR